MLARRLLIALAVLMALTALAASLAPRADGAAAGRFRDPGGTGRAGPRARRGDAGRRRRGPARRGQGRPERDDRRPLGELDTVSLGDLGIETTEPDSPARFELLADDPGTYPIELLEADRQIGVLEIRE